MSMYQYKGLEDTIAAIATPIGNGGIGIVRLSGKDALSIAERLFKFRAEKDFSKIKSHTVHYGWVVRRTSDDEEIIDEVLLTFMRGPRSYTAEDVVEISCHGGIVPLKTILTLAIEAGARPAEPGEFTKRAFINGRIDLAQAEAVLDIIHAKTEAFLRVSAGQLKGELTIELESIRTQLMEIFVELEAIINFPEDDLDIQTRENILKRIHTCTQRVEKLLDSSEQGRILKEGIKIVLCGKPNVGKSSLLNALLRQPRAIVTHIEGTTRDPLEETAQIQGIPFQLVDTAGILEPRDLIEEEAVKRSHLYISSADLILFVLDASRGITDTDRRLMTSIQGRNILVVVNKNDLPFSLDDLSLKALVGELPIVYVSVVTKNGLEDLENAIVQNVYHARPLASEGILVSNVRHVEALKKCAIALHAAEELINDNISFEFVSEEVKQSVNCLDNITGRNIDEDLLETIFSSFCIGK